MSNMYGKYAPPAGGGNKYFKLKDNESTTIRIFSDEPLVRNSSFQDKPSTRYAWVVYNFEAKCAQIMDQSVLVYKSIENMALSPWGDPTTYSVQIKRTGEGTSTRYFFTPMPNPVPLTTEEQVACKDIDLKKEYPNGILISEAYGGKEVPAINDSQEPPYEDEFIPPTEEELNAIGF